MDYKNTLNLPQTGFPMKADLVSREPDRLKKWADMDLYGKIQAARAGAEKFVLHDGPPFANGDLHIGHALNKTLKDIIVRYKTLRGFSAPYVPGWDCHGLPIEFKVSQEMRKAGDTASDPAAIRKACDAYARKYIDIQRSQFKRLGVLGDWDNPYLTLNKEYEADELRLFADIVQKGFVYRGKKPVYWSIPCRTALAEAEVEYHDHVSQSIYVKFKIKVNEPDARVADPNFPKFFPGKNCFVLIWTTTPWTLPANLAVAFNSNLPYHWIENKDSGNSEPEYFLVAEKLANKISEMAGLKNATLLPVGPYAGEIIKKQITYEHPFCDRRGKMVYGDEFVTADSGTGFVHIAPGHGLEDYLVGRRENLPIYSPVDDNGCLCLTEDEMNGVRIGHQLPEALIGKSILERHGKSDANEAVLHELRVRHALLHQENYHHSYPFCWRSKTAVIFRAMDQWFIEIDHMVKPDGKSLVDRTPFREKVLAEINKVEWIPDWGKKRIEGAVKSRPDWCISRQRTWGVPIPAFYGENGVVICNSDIISEFANLVEKHGSNIWFEKPFEELWALLKPDNYNGILPISKSNDTLDVWIDSGSSSRSVLKQRPELHHNKPGDENWIADVYLEGSDQHRGWFQSSLLLSMAGNGQTPFKSGPAPFKTVLTHGFMVDADREKISKSKQSQAGYEKPQTSEAYIKKYGADVVRLWVASQDYRTDIVVSEERINKVSETYRGIRNTLRYQLSNLYDFDPVKHSVPDDKLTGLDRWILSEFSKLETEVIEAYDKYEFHVVYQKVSQFIAVELSAIYHDVVKDRLYTDAANSPRRRSTQTALHRLVTGLCQLLGPVLVFTADESWEFIPGVSGSVHESVWKRQGEPLMHEMIGKWEWLNRWREKILPELEKARQAKAIGKALEAKVEIVVPEVQWQLTDEESLRELVNVSALKISKGETEAVQVAKADGQKCERCWHWETDVGSNPEHPTICARCVAAVKENLAR